MKRGIDILAPWDPVSLRSMLRYCSWWMSPNSVCLADDTLSDDMMESVHHIMLPAPDLNNLAEVEGMIRAANGTQPGREALAKFIVNSDYISKLAPLVEKAEDLHSLDDLHRLCNIMKILILLNDTAIIEYVVMDDVVLGVVGALEYDPDFPSHKANHRQYLSDESRFKEVVTIEDINIKKKIHYTYRLQYLKDVVLARILDDPTFSVLNSLIFFHQVDIVQSLQANVAFLKELFGIFSPSQPDGQRKKDAVLFIQQCCAVAKSLQNGARNTLYQNFISAGLFAVIIFALRHPDASVRVAGTDILVALIDHDPLMMRSQIFKAIQEKTKPLTDTLIELLLVEVDLGVKAQMADAIKVLLDPHQNASSVETLNRTNGDILTKIRGQPVHQPETFIQTFYEDSAKKLFQPLRELEHRERLDNLTVQEVSLYSHLTEVLCFFARQHPFRSKIFILSENLSGRVSRLMTCPEKHLKLTAIKYFRICIALQDEFHNRHIIQNNLLDPLVDIVFETMPRDNLLNSACLELFEYVKRENIKVLVAHIAERYAEKFRNITYVDTFQALLNRHEQNEEAKNNPNMSFVTETDGTPNRGIINGGQRWGGLKDADAEEEAYFNGDDEDDEPTSAALASMHSKDVNGANPVRPLVSYPEDDEEGMDILTDMDVGVDPTPEAGPAAEAVGATPTIPSTDATAAADSPPTLPSSGPAPPERLSEKRRREEDDDDDLGKLTAAKRRLSTGSNVSLSSSGSVGQRSKGQNREQSPQESDGDSSIDSTAEEDGAPAKRQEKSQEPAGKTHATRKKRTPSGSKDGSGIGGKRIAISLSVQGSGGRGEGE
jgi:protein phosphatase 4 regulatory subunit 3